MFIYLAAPWHIKFPGQGSESSHRCDLSCSFGHAGSLTVPGRGSNLHPSAPKTLPVLLRRGGNATSPFIKCLLVKCQLCAQLWAPRECYRKLGRMWLPPPPGRARGGDTPPSQRTLSRSRGPGVPLGGIQHCAARVGRGPRRQGDADGLGWKGVRGGSH